MLLGCDILPCYVVCFWDINCVFCIIIARELELVGEIFFLMRDPSVLTFNQVDCHALVPFEVLLVLLQHLDLLAPLLMFIGSSFFILEVLQYHCLIILFIGD